MSLIGLGKTFVRTAPAPAGYHPPPVAANRTDNYEGLTKYIPVETITLFVAAMAAEAALRATAPWLTVWAIYAVCAVLTPLIVWVGAVREHKAAARPDPMPRPWWRMVAATVAFLVWSLSIPPLLDDPGRLAAGVGALFVSTLLTLFDPLFDKV